MTSTQEMGSNVVYRIEYILHQWKLGFAMISVLSLTCNNFFVASSLFSKLSEAKHSQISNQSSSTTVARELMPYC